VGDNIKFDLKKIGSECVDWNGMAEDGELCWNFVNAVMNTQFA
jgi:hypothetical protein